MFKNKLSAHFHSNFFLFTLLVLVVGVVCSKFLMSLGLMLGALGFLIELDFKNYGKNLKSNSSFLLILGFYFLHIIGLLWSENSDYGLNDIRVKFSLLAIALIVCSRPVLTQKQLRIFNVIFVVSLFISSFVNVICYQFFQDQINYIDIRDLSLFGSHIRFGILIALGVAVNYSLWKQVPKWRIFWFISSLWFVYYTYFSQVLSGVVSLVVVVFVLLFWELFLRKKWWLIGSTVLVFASLKIAVFVYLLQPIQMQSSYPENYSTLKTEWNKRASIPYDSLDTKKQQIKFTLERYLISKKLPVRGEGVGKLSDSDIQNIEKGYADINELKPGLIARLYGLRYQIHIAANPNGHSLLERLHYWKVALKISKENLLFGVGTGDVNDRFLKKYDEINSPLLSERRLRAHNTYLTELVTFGVFGLVFFALILIHFFYQQLKYRQLFGVIFILVAAVTFVFEDTLETQMGITFFALFFSVYSRKLE